MKSQRETRPLYRDDASRLSMVTVEEFGVERRYVTLESEDAGVVRKVVAVVGDLLRKNNPQFTKEMRRGRVVIKSSPLGRKLQDCLRENILGVHLRLVGLRIHPYYEAFRDLTAKYNIRLVPDEQLAEMLNRFVEELRTVCASLVIKRRIDNAKRAARANTRSAFKVLSECRLAYSKVLAIRIDLEYLALVSDRLRAAPIDEAAMKKHRESFVTLLREGSYAQHLIGYVWKTEWGIQRGFHHHILILFNGQKVCSDIRIADDLCARWKYFITLGRGASHNCNKEKELYQHCGIGMLSRRDDEKWEVLREAVRYVTKAEVYIKGMVDGSRQCFGVGGPYECKSGSGRKRVRLKPGGMPSRMLSAPDSDQEVAPGGLQVAP